MTGLDTISAASAFACLGVLAGAVHLNLLSWNVRALLGGSPGLAPLAAALARLGVTVAAFAVAATHGALAIMATLAGFLLARTVLARRPELLLP